MSHRAHMFSRLVSYWFHYLDLSSAPHPPWIVVLLPSPLAVTATDPLAVQSLLDPAIVLHLVKMLTTEPTTQDHRLSFRRPWTCSYCAPRDLAATTASCMQKYLKCRYLVRISVSALVSTMELLEYAHTPTPGHLPPLPSPPTHPPPGASLRARVPGAAHSWRAHTIPPTPIGILTLGTIITPVIGIVPHMDEMNVDVIIAPATISIVIVIVDAIIALILEIEIEVAHTALPLEAIFMIGIGDNLPAAALPGMIDMDPGLLGDQFGPLLGALHGTTALRLQLLLLPRLDQLRSTHLQQPPVKLYDWHRDPAMKLFYETALRSMMPHAPDHSSSALCHRWTYSTCGSLRRWRWGTSSSPSTSSSTAVDISTGDTGTPITTSTSTTVVLHSQYNPFFTPFPFSSRFWLLHHLSTFHPPSTSTTTITSTPTPAAGASRGQREPHHDLLETPNLLTASFRS